MDKIQGRRKARNPGAEGQGILESGQFNRELEILATLLLDIYLEKGRREKGADERFDVPESEQ
jgi:hypothetical protein